MCVCVHVFAVCVCRFRWSKALEHTNRGSSYLPEAVQARARHDMESLHALSRVIMEESWHTKSALCHSYKATRNMSLLSNPQGTTELAVVD